MLTIKNATLADGYLYTIQIQEGIFTTVTKQQSLEKSSKHTQDLSTIETSHMWDTKDHTCDAQKEMFVPGGIDAHIHSRDPGHSHKEDWLSLEKACFKGGITTVIDMPNTNPPTLYKENIIEKAQKASNTQLDYKFFVGVGSENLGKINDLLEDSTLPVAGLKVYYGQSTGNMMFSDLSKLNHINDSIIVFHSEDQCCIDKNLDQLIEKNYIIKEPKDFIIHSQIRNKESALSSTKKILEWAYKQNKRIHMAHITTGQEVQLIKKYQSRGLNVSSEVTAHHLFFSEDNYETLGGFLKVNPPVRSKSEMLALRSCVFKGEIDCFATDHAPHLRGEKSGTNYAQVPSGIPSVEFFWPLVYELSKTNEKAQFAALSALASKVPAKIFGFKNLGAIQKGYHADMVWLKKRTVPTAKSKIIAKCQWSPYENFHFSYQVEKTWKKGKLVYSYE